MDQKHSLENRQRKPWPNEIVYGTESKILHLRKWQGNVTKITNNKEKEKCFAKKWMQTIWRVARTSEWREHRWSIRGMEQKGT